jgi:hypothetical protein
MNKQKLEKRLNEIINDDGLPYQMQYAMRTFLNEVQAGTFDDDSLQQELTVWKETVGQLKQQNKAYEQALDKAILEIRIWSNCYGDEASKQVAQKIVEELRHTLKGDNPHE